MPKYKVWTKIQWPFNSEVKTETWVKSFGRGKVFLRNEKDFPFTCSFGANSDLSYSGCFFEVEEVKTLEQAKSAIDIKMNSHY